MFPTHEHSKVNLSGCSNKVGGSTSFIVTLRQQREARNVALRRSAAASTLQRCVRGYICVAKRRRAFLKQLQESTELLDCTDRLSPAASLSIIRAFVFVAFSPLAKEQCRRVFYAETEHIYPPLLWRTLRDTALNSRTAPCAADTTTLSTSSGCPAGNSKQLLRRRVVRKLNRLIDSRRDVALGRSFFALSQRSSADSNRQTHLGRAAGTSSAVDYNACKNRSGNTRQQQQQLVATDLVNFTVQLAKAETSRRVSWLPAHQITLLEKHIFPLTYRALREFPDALPSILYCRVFYLVLMHIPRSARPSIISCSFSLTDQKILTYIFVLMMQRYTSQTARFLIASGILCELFELRSITRDMLRTTLLALRDASCPWQRRLFVTLLRYALNEEETYAAVWESFDEGLLRYFAGHESSVLTQQLLQNEYYFASISQELTACNSTRSFVQSPIQADCEAGLSVKPVKTASSAEQITISNLADLVTDALDSAGVVALDCVVRLLLLRNMLWSADHGVKTLLPSPSLPGALVMTQLLTFLRGRVAGRMSSAALVFLDMLLTTCFAFWPRRAAGDRPPDTLHHALGLLVSDPLLQSVDRLVAPLANMQFSSLTEMCLSNAPMSAALTAINRIFFPLRFHPWLERRLVYKPKTTISSAAYDPLNFVENNPNTAEDLSNVSLPSDSDDSDSDFSKNENDVDMCTGVGTNSASMLQNSERQTVSSSAALLATPRSVSQAQDVGQTTAYWGRFRQGAQDDPCETLRFLQHYLEKAYRKKSYLAFLYSDNVVSLLSQTEAFLMLATVQVQCGIYQAMHESSAFGWPPDPNATEMVNPHKRFKICSGLIERLLEAECFARLLHSSVVLGTLLEAQLRPLSRNKDITIRPHAEQDMCFTLSELSSERLSVDVLVFFLNCLASTLVQMTSEHTPNSLWMNRKVISSVFPVFRQDYAMLGCASALLGRALRDLHRLRADILPPEAWIADTTVLKPTTLLMKIVERYRLLQFQYTLPDGFLLRKERFYEITFEPTRRAVRTLSALLTTLPYSFQFQDRSLILTLLLIDEKIEALGEEHRNPYFMRHKAHFRIRRSHIVEDTLSGIKEEQLASWKSQIAITFIDTFGNPEKGVDGGGLFREYLIHLSRTLFSPGFGLFDALPDRSLVPSSTAHATHGAITDTLFQLAGTVVGKAIYEFIVLEPIINRTFFNALQRKETRHLEDLLFLDPELFKQLRMLEHHENIEDFQLTFSATVKRGEGLIEEIDLIPDGRSIHVNRANVNLYRNKLTDFHLNKRFAREAELFCEGLRSVVPLEWLCWFDGLECSQLVSGEHQEFDLGDFAAHVEYSGGFTPNSETIVNLWEVLKSMDTAKRSKFLMFATGCPRPPFLGFRMLQPRFKIQHVDDLDLLPTSFTCVNQLNLPAYPSIDVLREKLLAAIDMAPGFDLY